MRLVAWGGDERMKGLVQAAERAGWEAVHVGIKSADDPGEADAVALPWPHSFKDGKLTGTAINQEDVIGAIKPCKVLLAGSGAEGEVLKKAERLVRPGEDEAFLRFNAQLTAEGALLSILRRRQGALLGKMALITGYGRIGQEMAARLCAMGMFVVVCARNEGQMRMAHSAGAHPVPLAEMAAVCEKADVIVNTVPARVFSKATLERIRLNTPIIELASAPYGLDLDEAVRIGLEVVVESGLPGRYAPMDAGAALFACIERAVKEEKK